VAVGGGGWRQKAVEVAAGAAGSSSRNRAAADRGRNEEKKTLAHLILVMNDFNNHLALFRFIWPARKVHKNGSC